MVLFWNFGKRIGLLLCVRKSPEQLLLLLLLLLLGLCAVIKSGKNSDVTTLQWMPIKYSGFQGMQVTHSTLPLSLSSQKNKNMLTLS